MANAYDSVRLTLVIFMVCLGNVYSFIVVYYYYQLLGISKWMMIKKRHPSIIKYQTFLQIIILSFIGPFIALDFSHLHIYSPSVQLLITRINRGIYPAFTFSFFLFSTWRAWHMFYDLKHSSIQDDSKWIYHLNATLVKENFWLKHIGDYGSEQYTKKIIYKIVVICTIFDVSLYQLTVTNNVGFYISIFVDLLLHSIPPTITLILWWKLPIYNDHFFVRDELRYTAWTLIIVNAVVAVFFIIGIVVNDIVIGLMAAIFICQQMVFIIAMLQLKWTTMKAIKSKILLSEQPPQRCTSMSSSMSSTSSLILTVKHLFSNKITLKLLMATLAKEFSMECLLSTIEILQYKNELKKIVNIINPKNELNCVNTKELSNSVISNLCDHDIVTQSVLVKNGFYPKNAVYKLNGDECKLLERAKNICLMLYGKYIDYESELTVNISSQNRNTLDALMEDSQFFINKVNINLNELYCLYDDVAIEMIQLLDGAYSRFTLTTEFETACNVLNVKIESIANTEISL